MTAELTGAQPSPAEMGGVIVTDTTTTILTRRAAIVLAAPGRLYILMRP